MRNLAATSFCRICGEECSTLWTPIFQDSYKDLREKISFFLSIKLEESSLFPRKICHNCRRGFDNILEYFRVLYFGQVKLVNLMRSPENGESLTGPKYSKRRSLIINNDKKEKTTTHQCQCSCTSQSLPVFSSLLDDEHATDSGFTCNICFKKHACIKKQQDEEQELFECELIPKNCPISKEFPHKFTKKTQGENFQMKRHGSKCRFLHKMCYADFASNNILECHQAILSGQKNFECYTCEKKFSYQSSLIHHNKLHKDSKLFQCKHCPKTFNQHGNLQVHLRIHSGEKPFFCSTCTKKFRTSSQQKNHEKRHKGERPWKCEFCDRSFSFKSSLILHIRRHKEDKPYECTYCNKKFVESWALKKHTRLHTGEKPYSCMTCGRKFSDSSNLAKHCKTHCQERRKGRNLVYEVIRDAVETSNEDVQQIIYITYDEDKTFPESTQNPIKV